MRNLRFVVGGEADVAKSQIAPAEGLVERLVATVQANGYRHLEPVERDLLRLAAGVVFADRTQRRPM
ncbi:MAG: hypothetical protein WBG92_06295, partial [Thiohalocapsa sp.]